MPTYDWTSFGSSLAAPSGYMTGSLFLAAQGIDSTYSRVDGDTLLIGSLKRSGYLSRKMSSGIHALLGAEVYQGFDTLDI